MPRSAIKAGAIDYVLPPEAIAGKIEAISSQLRLLSEDGDKA
jgi:chemotaxis response regulator CheB